MLVRRLCIVWYSFNASYVMLLLLLLLSSSISAQLLHRGMENAKWQSITLVIKVKSLLHHRIKHHMHTTTPRRKHRRCGNFVPSFSIRCTPNEITWNKLIGISKRAPAKNGTFPLFSIFPLLSRPLSHSLRVCAWNKGSFRMVPARCPFLRVWWKVLRRA